MITVESTRPDHVGAYGYALPTTPAIDRLASEATVFGQAYSVTSWTLPSHASLFTGLYPAAHGVVAFNHRLHDSHRTLAEALSAAGYRTAAFVSGPFLQRQHALDQGFELYDESSSNPEGNRAAHADVTNPRIGPLIETYLRETAGDGRPLFLFAYLWDPHYDYIPPPPWDDRFVPAGAEPVELRDYETRDHVTADLSPGQLDYVISQYDGEIGWTDALLGELWAVLRELGMWEDTAIVVTADHGEEFFEHGHKGHRNTLYDESVRVPLVVKVPGEAIPRRDDRLVSLVDVFPTVLGIAGVDAVPYHHGRSLLAPADPSRPVFLELKTEWLVRDPETGETGMVSDLWLAVRAGSHKLVLSRNRGRSELYDLAADPGEKVPLAPSSHAAGAALDAALEAHLQAMRRDAARWQRSDPIVLRPEQEERLRSLGYLGRSDPGE